MGNSPPNFTKDMVYLLLMLANYGLLKKKALFNNPKTNKNKQH